MKSSKHDNLVLVKLITTKVLLDCDGFNHGGLSGEAFALVPRGLNDKPVGTCKPASGARRVKASVTSSNTWSTGGECYRNGFARFPYCVVSMCCFIKEMIGGEVGADCPGGLGKFNVLLLL